MSRFIMLSDEQQEALARLLHERYGYIYAVAQQYAPNSGQIDDIVQQVYVDFIDGLVNKHWNFDRAMNPLLLYQIAKRKAQLYWRKRRIEKTCWADMVEERLMLSLETADAREEDERLECESKVDALRICLKKLPAKSRAIIEEHYFDGVAIKELGRRRDLKETTVYHFFCRIRSKLRDCIERVLHE